MLTQTTASAIVTGAFSKSICFALLILIYVSLVILFTTQSEATNDEHKLTTAKIKTIKIGK